MPEPIPPTMDEQPEVDRLARDICAIPPWVTLVAEPGKQPWQEWRYKVPRSIRAVREILERFSPRFYRFTVARFADDSVLFAITPADAPVGNIRDAAKGK